MTRTFITLWRRARVLLLTPAVVAGARLMLLALVIVAMLPFAALAADPPAAAGQAPKGGPVKVEAVPGTTVKKVTLTPRAAERIDIKLGAVEERKIVPTQMIGGILVDPSAAGLPETPAKGSGAAGPATAGVSPGKAPPAADAKWVRIAVSSGEWNRISKDKPVRVLPLETRQDMPASMPAVPTDFSGQDNSKSGMLSVFYAIQGPTGAAVTGQRVRVDVPLEVVSETRKTVPYAAVLYDAKGDAWVYVQTAPLTFVRQRIALDRVVGEYALLTQGPAPGTVVVTVGVSMLYGSEVFGK